MYTSTTAAAQLPRPASYLDTLNREQRLAVEHGVTVRAGEAQRNSTGEGALLIIAGAGSGKTNTLAHRVAHLVCTGADPHRILLLTFSRRAAAEMERRAGRVLNRVLGARGDRPAPSLSWSGTFHGVGARLLRGYAERIGISPSFTIHDRGDGEDLMAIARHELGLDALQKRFPAKGTCMAIYSRVINSEAALGVVLKSAFPWCAQWETELAGLFRRYVEAKQAQQILDYDDLLLYWSQMVQDPVLAAEIGGRFDHVLVDEYQDTNRLQATILRAIKPDGRGLTVVGDDAQSIYSFRAATVRNILDFPAQFTLPARIVTLERNYRSTQPILEASNAVIGLASERHAKNLWTDRASSEKPELVSVRDEIDQARCVAERVLQYREAGMALKSQAVLFRTSSHSASLELELARRDIPFVKFGGLRFLEAAHIKDILCVLRWAENPRGRMAGFRVLRLLPGIGPATASKLLDAMDRSASPMTVLESFHPPLASLEDWHALVELIGQLRKDTANWPADMDRVVQWYEPHMQRIYDDAPARLSDLAQLQQIAPTYATRERFLTEVTLDPPGATSEEAGVPGLDDDYLVLSTIHSAKGQEWKAVQVLNVVDGCIPSDMSTGTSEGIEEERRLLYVAMTRAKDHLRLLLPQKFYVQQQAASGDRHVYASRSRFIPNALTRYFEPSAWPAVAAGSASTAANADATNHRIDLSARIRGLWQ